MSALCMASLKLWRLTHFLYRPVLRVVYCEIRGFCQNQFHPYYVVLANR